MAAKKQHNQFLKSRLNTINKVVGKFENEVEKALEKFVLKGEKSSQILRKNFDEIFDKISSTPFYSKATEKTEELTKELRKVADEVVGKLKNFDLNKALPALKEVRANIDELVSKVQGLDFVEKARKQAKKSKNQFLSVLSIPTQDDIEQLSRKVTSLEKKIKVLSHKKEAA